MLFNTLDGTKVLAQIQCEGGVGYGRWLIFYPVHRPRAAELLEVVLVAIDNDRLAVEVDGRHERWHREEYGGR